ncbi:hypothetical protein ATN00_21825 (plasmid) [Sphingobium baderi]|uniref:Resolvase/invertase-type recombinase catalytic domain-containing protein n=1 Tax=Sphingobium baderi TaxID=1332080 RepID=A0A0S3F691_9SPHN|nr:recombinase family protein [Sphingobium baderi]ALR23143.1 hypothetical protein ATN00_21825 [Sphingobium baderi]
MLIGYARVSTGDQNLGLQIDALNAAGCDKLFADEGVSGAAVFKPQLEAALDFARSGEDVIVVWRLDRLGRSVHDLIEIGKRFEAQGLGFRSIKESMIDTTSASGRLFYHMLGAFAQFERDAMLERTMAGIAAAKARGKKFGRPPSLSDEQWNLARELLTADPPRNVSDIATLLGVSRQAIYRRMERDRLKASSGNECEVV